jgi:MFS family permease
LGLITAVDNPTRQTFIVELVGDENFTNAVTLNSTEFNLARVIGPTIAGFLIATLGIAACFVFNGLSYIAVIIGIFMMRQKELHLTETVKETKGQLMEGFRYIWRTAVLRDTLIMMAIIGTLTFEFQVILPLIAQFTFKGDAGTYAAMSAAMGLGSMIGALFTAQKSGSDPKNLIKTAFLFGLVILVCAAMPTLPLIILALVLVGIFSINFTILGNVTLQMESEPKMRGRVMALWSVAFIGTTPIGGPIIGWVGENIGPRFGLVVGGSAAILASLFGLWTLRESKPLQVLSRNILARFESEAESDRRIP